MGDPVPALGHGRRHDHGAARLADRLDEPAEVAEARRDQGEDRIHVGEDGIRAPVGHPVHDDVEALARLVAPRREHRRHRAHDRAARAGDRAGDDLGDRERIGAERVDLEDRPAEPALEMPAHLVEHGVHAVTVDRHRHAVGRVGHADRFVGREPDAHGLPAAVEAAHVPGVHVDEKVGLGDAPVHDHRIAVLGRPSEIDEAVRVLRVVAREPCRGIRPRATRR